MWTLNINEENKLLILKLSDTLTLNTDFRASFNRHSDIRFSV